MKYNKHCKMKGKISTKGCYKEHRNPSLPARLGLTLLDKCPSCWYNNYMHLNYINFSEVKKE
jgi:hypothetical protein